MVSKKGWEKTNFLFMLLHDFISLPQITCIRTYTPHRCEKCERNLHLRPTHDQVPSSEFSKRRSRTCCPHHPCTPAPFAMDVSKPSDLAVLTGGYFRIGMAKPSATRNGHRKKKKKGIARRVSW